MITDATGSTGYSYDANGHVMQKIQTAGAVSLTMTYGYDAGGRLASVAYPSGQQIVYAYDAAGRVSSATANGHLLFGSGWTAGNGASYRRTIDQDGRITGLALPAGDTIALSYDAARRITGLAETGQPAQNFGYDAHDRLATYASGAATQNLYLQRKRQPGELSGQCNAACFAGLQHRSREQSLGRHRRQLGREFHL